MSPSGAWRRRVRWPSSPPDASAGRGFASRRRAASSARPGPRAARGLRAVLASALLALALLAGLPDGALAQPTVGFSASTASVSEDAGSIDLTLTLSPAQTTDVAVVVKTVPNTASQGDRTGTDGHGNPVYATVDYTPLKAHAVTIPAGSTSATVSVSIVDDRTLENGDPPNGEDFKVKIVSIAGVAQPDGDEITITILDNERVLAFEKASYAFEEDAGSVALEITVSRALPSAQTVPLSVADLTSKPADRTVPASFTVPANSKENIELSVDIHDNDVLESARLFRVTIDDPNLPDDAIPATTDVVILDDDAPVLSISAPADADEGDSGTTDRYFEVTLSKAVAKSFSFTVCFSGTATGTTDSLGTLSANDDYSVLVESRPSAAHRCRVGEIAAGATSSTLLGIRVRGDTDLEGDETVVATLSLRQSAIDAGVELGTSTATHTIQGDDRRILSISAPSDADEGDSGTTDRYFEVSLSKPVAKSAGFKICFSGTATGTTDSLGTLSANDDYSVLVESRPSAAHRCRVGEIAAGATSSTLLGIRVRGDTDLEGDETVVATLSLRQSAIDAGIELGTSTATHTIQGDDRRILSISAPSDADEGDSGTTDRYFEVSLSKPVAKSAGFKICFSGTATGTTDSLGTLSANDDYSVLVESRPSAAHRCRVGEIAAGATSSTLLGIRVRGDTDLEGDETVVATLSLRQSAIDAGIELGTSTATHTIRGDDGATPRVRVTPDASAVTEGEEARFTLTRSGGAVGALRVALVYRTSGAFFRRGLVNGELWVTLPSGQHSAGIAIPTVDDAADEADGWVEVAVQDSFAAYLGDYDPGRHGDYDTYAGGYDPKAHYPYEPGSPDRARVAVADDEAGAPLTAYLTPVPAIAASGLPEGATAWFNVRLSRALAAHETVALPLSLGGDAARGTDYTLGCGEVAGMTCGNLESGDPSLTVDGSRFDGNFGGKLALQALSLTAVEDDAEDSPRPVTLSLGGNTLRFDIVDAPLAVTIVFTRDASAVREDRGPAQPLMRITPPAGRDIPLHFTLGGTATRGTTGNWDYYIRDFPTVVPAGTSVHHISIHLSSVNGGYAVDEPDETVVLTLDTSRLPEGVAAGAITVNTLTIHDADPTVVSLARTGTGAVREGATVEFTVSLGRALVAGEVVDVPLAVSGTGVTPADWSLALKAGAGLNTGVTPSRADTATPRLRFAGEGAETATLELVPVDDGVDEGGETWTVALGPDGTGANGFDHPDLGTNLGRVGADPHPTRNRFAVAVREGGGVPLPVLTLAGGPAVTEGAAARFTVTATPAPAAGETLLVNIGVEDAPGADFLAAAVEGGNGVWEFAGGAATRTFTLATVPDDADEPSGPVKVTLRPRTGTYTVGDPASASVTVNDDDGAAAVPTVTVSAGAAVTEGGGAEFTVSASPAPTADLTVHLTVADDGTGDFVASADEGARTVVIGANQASAPFTVATVDDSTDEADGAVAVTVAASQATPADYAVGTQASASVTVRDDDVTIQTVTVSGGGAVTEGGDAQFTLTAAPAPAADLTVHFNVDDGVADDFVAPGDEGSKTAVIPAGAVSVAWTVATVDDQTDEADGAVTLTIQDSGGYVAGSPASATVPVKDDDDPAVTVAAGGAVTEGGEALFTLTAVRAPAAPLAVRVTVATDGEYGVAAGRRTVTIPTTGSAVLTLATADDDADELDGAVSVTVTAGRGYRPGEPASATVAVRDDDEPVVTIAARAASVTEGDDARFAVTADRAPARALTVALMVSETGAGDHVAAASEGPASVTLASGATEAAFALATVYDGVDEPDSVAVVTVKAGEGYAVGSPASASVTVRDGGAAPALSVADMTVPESSEFAGETVSLRYLTVRLSGPSGREVTVRVDTRPSTPVSARAREDYWPVEGHVARFRPGATEARVPFLIYDDSHDEGAETFEFVLSGAVGATIGAGVAVVTITNDDPMPAAWLSRFGRTVAEQALDGIAGRMAAPRTPGMQGAIAGQAVGFGPTHSPGSGSPGSLSGAGGTPAAGGVPSAASGTAPADREAALALADVAQAFGGNTGGPGSLSGAGFGETPPQSRTMTARDVLLGSSFSLTGEADGSGGSMAFWGRASQARFDGREGTFSLDGTATTAMLGADYARGKWLIGLALAQSEGEGDYRDTKTTPRPPLQFCDEVEGETPALCDGAVRTGDGRVEASLTAAVPYAALQVSERLKLWGAAGYGSGRVTLKTALGGRYSADTDWSMAAAGLRSDLLEVPREGSGPALALTSDALWARTSSEKTRDLAASRSDVTRLRLGLEGSYRVALDGGGTITPKLELGARHDGGDAETGFGVELGGGVKWTDPGLGLMLDLSGRTLIAHGNDDLKDRGFSAALAYDPAPATKRGASLSLRQDFGGKATGGLDALFAPDPLDDRTGSEATSRWAVEAAYGLPAFGGRWTGSPHVGLGLATGARDYSVGWRLTPEGRDAPDLSFGLKATRRESATAAPEHALWFEARLQW